MKAVLSSSANPTFTPASGTLNFATAVASYGFQFGRLLGIINLTQNAILYTAGVSGYGGSWNSGTSVLTLAQSTTGMGASDVLEVIWDDPQPGIVLQAPLPTVPGGWPSKFHLVTAATTNATSVKASAGTLGGVYLGPPSAQYAYAALKIYDKASAPTVGTDVPVLSLVSQSSYWAANPVIIPPAGIKFNNGIAIAVTSNVPDTDTGATTAGFIVDLFYA
jgi:hypothetical protein